MKRKHAGVGQNAPDLPADAADGDLRLEPGVYRAGGIEYRADYGWLVVPENRSRPDSRLIQLPVTWIHSTGDHPLEPIYYLAGGPGQSNLDFQRIAGLIGQHDFLLVGYRGVDGSVRLDCPEMPLLLANPPGDLLGRATWDAAVEANRTCADRLIGEGIDLAGYTVTETVDDLEAARRAFGDRKVNTLSQSYGTRLAMIWAWRYPEALHRSALISVNPPGHFVWSPEVTDQQIEHYAQLCKQDPRCNRRTDDLAAAMRRVSRSMPTRWLIFPIKRSNVLIATFSMLYNTTSAPKVLDAWLAADSGDPSGLALISLMTERMLSATPSVWGESIAKAASSDYVFEEGRNYLAEFSPEDSIIGAPVSALGFAGAKGWPGNLIDDSLRTVQPSSSEMLLISGSIDFSTPARFATEELLPALENGHQVILREFGHTGDVWELQPEATRHLLATYFATGAVDDSRYEANRVDFDPGIGFGTMAKLVLGAILGVLGLTALGARWLVGRRSPPAA